jgi:allophanate hydrolase subunit 2
MGFRLNNLGDKLPKISFPKNSNPVWPGVIQWTGIELICLGKDCQTLGGYPRVMI